MNQRRRTRVESQKDVTMRWDGGEAAGQVVNLSLKGCLIAPAPGAALPPLERPLAVTIHLEEGAPELDVAVQGRVVRAEAGFGVAVDFREVSPDSFQHLFRLVQYNAADPEDIEGELGTSAFDSPLP
jgi:hypothetical protein